MQEWIITFHHGRDACTEYQTLLSVSGSIGAAKPRATDPQLCLDLRHGWPFATTASSGGEGTPGAKERHSQRCYEGCEQEPEECRAGLQLAAGPRGGVASICYVVAEEVCLEQSQLCGRTQGGTHRRLTALVQLWTRSLAARTIPAIKVNRVARASRARRTKGMARLSTKAATRPYRTTIQSNAATNITKLTLAALPANIESMALPTKAVIRRTRKNCTARRAIWGMETMMAGCVFNDFGGDGRVSSCRYQSKMRNEAAEENTGALEEGEVFNGMLLIVAGRSWRGDVR